MMNTASTPKATPEITTIEDFQPMTYSTKSYSYTPTRSAPLTPTQWEDAEWYVEGLKSILSWRRPHDSQAEAEFVAEHLAPLGNHPNVDSYEVDGFGNIWVTVGERVGEGVTPILFSCHIDTVSSKGGRQAIGWKQDEQDVLCLVKPKAGRSLGADDGAGLWLMLQMIGAGIAGNYVFHRGEEQGRLGSRYVATSEPERLDGIQACIAFDRRDHDNLITHQMGERGCSIAFADSLIAELSKASNGALAYKHDDTGSYTDSYSYFDLVPECTNLSVGYDGEHGPRETLDFAHVWRLRNALVRIDWSKLAIERDHTAAIEYNHRGYEGLGNVTYSPYYKQPKTPKPPVDYSRDFSDYEDMRTLVMNYPEVAADLLIDLGMMPWDLIEALDDDQQGRALSLVSY